MSVLVLDAGNSIIKAKIANGETAFPHAMQPLTEGEYLKITSRASINGNSAEYIRVNGKPYVIGESAERHGVLVQRSGSARYTRDTMAFWQLPHLPVSMNMGERWLSLAAMRLVM